MKNKINDKKQPIKHFSENDSYYQTYELRNLYEYLTTKYESELERM